MATPNWVVKTKQLKKNNLYNHINYLTDKSRSSHFYTKIHVLTDNANNIVKSIECRQQARKKAGVRGGGIQNAATVFIMSLPREIPLNSRQWSKILHLTYRNIAKATELSLKEIREHSFAVLHDESESPDKCSHIHLVVSNVINEKMQKKITQKCTTHTVKMAFNEGVKATVGIDNLDYTPKRRQNKNRPQWVVQKEKAIKAEKKVLALKQSFVELIKSIKLWASNYLLNLVEAASLQAEEIAPKLNDIVRISNQAGDELGNMISNIEDVDPDMPDSAKITPKIKRKL